MQFDIVHVSDAFEMQVRFAVVPELLVRRRLLLLLDAAYSRFNGLERFTSTPADFTRGITIGYETKVSFVYSLRESV